MYPGCTFSRSGSVGMSRKLYICSSNNNIPLYYQNGECDTRTLWQTLTNRSDNSKRKQQRYNSLFVSQFRRITLKVNRDGSTNKIV